MCGACCFSVFRERLVEWVRKRGREEKGGGGFSRATDDDDEEASLSLQFQLTERRLRAQLVSARVVARRHQLAHGCVACPRARGLRQGPAAALAWGGREGRRMQQGGGGGGDSRSPPARWQRRPPAERGRRRRRRAPRRRDGTHQEETEYDVFFTVLVASRKRESKEQRGRRRGRRMNSNQKKKFSVRLSTSTSTSTSPVSSFKSSRSGSTWSRPTSSPGGPRIRLGRFGFELGGIKERESKCERVSPSSFVFFRAALPRKISFHFSLPLLLTVHAPLVLGPIRMQVVKEHCVPGPEVFDLKERRRNEES